MNLKEFADTILTFSERVTDHAPEVKIYFSVDDGDDLFSPCNVVYSKMLAEGDADTPYIVVNLT